MSHHTDHFLIFGSYFLNYFLFVHRVLIALLLMIVLGGVAIAYLEDLPFGDSIYFAFITGLTIGYGDIKPVTAWGRVVSIVIGIVGLIFTGMTIAIATRALASTAEDLKAQ